MKEHQKFLIPRSGLKVRHPVSKDILPEDGMLVDWTGPIGRYWRRRVNCGDCSIGRPVSNTPKQRKQRKTED